MIDAFQKEIRLRIAVLVFIFYTTWWIILQVSGAHGTQFHELFSDTYGVAALIGALVGYSVAENWGGWKSKMGKAIILFSLGLLAQAFGQFVYTYYYLVAGIEAPYPSLGDLGYFGSIPLYIGGMVLLADAAGVNFTLRKVTNQIQALVIPLFLLGISYMIFLQGYEFDLSQPLIILLDFGYPFGQAIYVSLALLTYFLSRKMLGGIMREKILFVLVALFVQYMADYTFLYQFANGTWSAGGINDFMYLISYFFMTLALFNVRVSEVRAKLVQK